MCFLPVRLYKPFLLAISVLFRVYVMSAFPSALSTILVAVASIASHVSVTACASIFSSFTELKIFSASVMKETADHFDSLISSLKALILAVY